MKRTSISFKCQLVLVILFFVLILSISASAAHYTAVWTNGDATQNWSNPNNWDINQIPLNGLDTFDVIIPDGFTVYFDIDESNSVTDFELASTSMLVIAPGHSLTALDDVSIDGEVQSDGSTTEFICNSVGTSLGNGAILSVSNGGEITCSAVDYSSTSLTSNVTLFSADGYPSVLNLPDLKSLDARFTSSYRTQTISATNQGFINMGETGTIYGATSSTSRLNIHMGSGGAIDFHLLTDILGGYTKFNIEIASYEMLSLATATQTTFDISDISTLSMPNLNTVTKCNFVIPDGGFVDAPVLTSLLSSQINLNPSRSFINGGMSNIDNSRITLTGGLEFGTSTGDVTATSYSSTGVGDNVTLFSTSGVDTILDLSSIETFNGAFPYSYRTHTLSAIDNGLLDLSSVGTIYGSTSSTSRLKFTVGSNGNIDLSSLLEIPSGYTTFDIDIPLYDLPLLQTASGVTFDASNVTTIDLPQLSSLTNSNLNLANDAVFNAPALTSFTRSVVSLNPSKTFINGGLSNIDNSQIILTEGEQFGTASGDITATAYSSTGLGDNVTLFSASGVDTIMDLSSIEIFNGAYPYSYRTQTLSATDNGLLDLSSVGTVYGATSNTSTLKFVMDTAGEIDLSSLQDIPSGYTYFDIDIPDYNLPMLETAWGVTFNASNVTTIDLPQLTTLTNSNLIMADEAIINAPLLTSLTSSIINLNPSRTFINDTLSNIDNTRITLTGGAEFGVATGDVDVTSYTSTGLNSNYTLFSVDGDGTLLDLSTVQTINAAFTASYRTQIFSVTNKAVLDLSGVGSIVGATSSTSSTKFNVDNGAQIIFGDNLNISGYAELNINGSDSNVVTTGGFALNAPSRLIATAGATLNLGGDFMFTLTNEADFSADASIFQFASSDGAMLEVGGEDLGLGGIIPGNFGIGQLIVGSSIEPTTLSVVDLVDNGNGNEALYLYGSGGLSGLRIRPDSTLIIGDINVYAYVEGEMIHINSYFTEGVKWIPFDEGRISLSEYECSLASDLTGDCFVGFDDFAIMASEWLKCGDMDCP